jgi:hypothetical protein
MVEKITQSVYYLYLTFTRNNLFLIVGGYPIITIKDKANIKQRFYTYFKISLGSQLIANKKKIGDVNFQEKLNQLFLFLENPLPNETSDETIDRKFIVIITGNLIKHNEFLTNFFEECLDREMQILKIIEKYKFPHNGCKLRKKPHKKKLKLWNRIKRRKPSPIKYIKKTIQNNLTQYYQQFKKC